MCVFTVVWHGDAMNLLAEIWLRGSDRPQVSDAANEIDRLLRIDPHVRGRQYQPRARCLTIPPLQVFFEVLDLDRLVRIAHVRRFPNPDSFSGGSNGKDSVISSE